MNSICLDAIQEGKCNQWISRLASLTKGDIAELIRNINRGQVIVHVEAPGSEAKVGELKNVLKEIPTGLQHLFSGIPLILVGGIASQAEDGKKLETALQ